MQVGPVVARGRGVEFHRRNTVARVFSPRRPTLRLACLLHFVSHNAMLVLRLTPPGGSVASAHVLLPLRQ